MCRGFLGSFWADAGLIPGTGRQRRTVRGLTFCRSHHLPDHQPVFAPFAPVRFRSLRSLVPRRVKRVWPRSRCQVPGARCQDINEAVPRLCTSQYPWQLQLSLASAASWLLIPSAIPKPSSTCQRPAAGHTSGPARPNTLQPVSRAQKHPRLWRRCGRAIGSIALKLTLSDAAAIYSQCNSCGCAPILRTAPRLLKQSSVQRVRELTKSSTEHTSDEMPPVASNSNLLEQQSFYAPMLLCSHQVGPGQLRETC
ncbi:hypothetical protein B0J14DRAFT_352174 [Halenospora varia]|nr:hypothetical protein B0J14DRAFT_352174 [Halenospora varia]